MVVNKHKLYYDSYTGYKDFIVMDGSAWRIIHRYKLKKEAILGVEYETKLNELKYKRNIAVRIEFKIVKTEDYSGWVIVSRPVYKNIQISNKDIKNGRVSYIPSHKWW